jgi:actin-related protein
MLEAKILMEPVTEQHGARKSEQTWIQKHAKEDKRKRTCDCLIAQVQAEETISDNTTRDLSKMAMRCLLCLSQQAAAEFEHLKQEERKR